MFADTYYSDRFMGKPNKYLSQLYFYKLCLPQVLDMNLQIGTGNIKIANQGW